jgi:toxin ParE1/3/4
MRNSIRLAKAAQQDLRDIWRGLAEYGQLSLADDTLADIESKFGLLGQFPNVGRARNDLLPELRSYPAKDFVIFYRLLTNTVEVVRVIHGSRDILAIFKDP